MAYMDSCNHNRKDNLKRGLTIVCSLIKHPKTAAIKIIWVEQTKLVRNPKNWLEGLMNVNCYYSLCIKRGSGLLGDRTFKAQGRDMFPKGLLPMAPHLSRTTRNMSLKTRQKQSIISTEWWKSMWLFFLYIVFLNYSGSPVNLTMIIKYFRKTVVEKCNCAK